MSAPPESSQNASSAPRSRRLDEAPPLAALAVQLLRTPNALVVLSDDDARCIVAHMQLVTVAAGQVMIRQGDTANTSFMLLLLSGEARVGRNDFGQGAMLDISVLGPGNIIGEMGVLDGAPRSTTCTAVSDVQAAGLSRRALESLIETHPLVGAHFMVALAKRMADRLRALAEQLGMYAQMEQTAQSGSGRR